MRYFKYCLSVTLLMTACASFERHRSSGYSDGTDLNAKKSRVETGDVSRMTVETELKILENRLTHQKDVEQYSKALPYLRGKQERIDFLKRPDFESRQAYLREIDIGIRAKENLESYRSVIESQDIAMGMTQELVRKAWGEPEKVEVSGNPAFRNERWRYQKLVSSPEGYRTEKKSVYFESGQVVGWELE